MTSETGNRRHPTGKGLTAEEAVVMPVPAWTHHRTLDPVKAAALTAAIAAYRYGFDWPDTDETPPPPDNILTEILTMAERFEGYLTGEEADGATD